MCGIAGKIGKGHYLGVPEMVTAQAHRGPDGRGVNARATVTLGHNLLATRAESATSRQPWVTKNASLLTYNGEVYDFFLDPRYVGSGNWPAAGLDTAVLAERLERYGKKALNVVDGMYALAFWHHDTGNTLLARDRLGAKPLYYAETGTGVAFASELRTLFAGGVKKVLDPVGVRLYLQFGYVPGPRTLIAGVNKLVPGECREYDPNGRLLRAWNTTKPVEPTAYSAYHYRQKLVDAVAATLPTVREHGLFLSGGMDSSSILWAMNELGHKPQTMSMRFQSEGAKQVLLDQDSDLACLLAQKIGTNHTEVMFREADYLAHLGPAFSADEPIARKGMPAYAAAYRYAKEAGWVVAFTGDGGDELLSGYGRHMGLMREVPDPAEGPVATWVRLQSQATPDCFTPAAAHAAEFGVLSYMLDWLPDVLTGERLRDELAIEGVTTLAEDMLIRADKLGMAHGLEARFPLLAEPFRSYALGLPAAVKIKTGADKAYKWCARDAMRFHLPVEIIDKAKSGWAPPTGAWLAGKDTLVGPFGDKIRETVVPGRVPAVDAILDVTKVTRIKVKLALFYLMLWAEETQLA